jgi:serine/threonine protein kinase
MAHYIFISYANEDKTVADTICKALESKNIRCWIAPRDVEIGVDFAEAILDAIDLSRIFLLVLSSHSNNSPHVRREVGEAANKGIPIIPLLIEDIVPSRIMQYFISNYEWLDAYKVSPEIYLQQLSKRAQEILNKECVERIADLVEKDSILTDKEKNRLKAALSSSLDLHMIYDFDEQKVMGYGSIATVYKALRKGTRQERALKLLKSEYKLDAEIVERFLQEATVFSRLDHPGIVHIYTVNIDGETLDCCIEMEYVDGETLRDFTGNHDFDWSHTLEFTNQLCSAIQKMHESGYIHRNLNPHNIMVDKDGNLKIMDLSAVNIVGLEKLAHDTLVKGTLDYMAPEQSGGAEVDERADIYTFGVILYELCTRTLPSPAPLPLRHYEPLVPEWLENIVANCLKQDREQRYASIGGMLVAIKSGEKAAISIKCDVHPDRDAVGMCEFCEKKLCQDCAEVISGKHYCHVCADIVKRKPPLAPGTVLQDRYEILELMRTTDIAYIYSAKDKKFSNRYCTVKQINEPIKADVDLLKKLQDELLKTAQITHSNVAMILDHFIDGEYYFLVSEQVKGKPLSGVYKERQGKLSEDEVVNWAIAVCDITGYAHKEGFIHGDISPDNIMLNDKGVVHFVDFGTLRKLYNISSTDIEKRGNFGYTPPEQWSDNPAFQSDVFALGATVYFLLTGYLPLSKSYLSGHGPQKQDYASRYPPVRKKNTDVSQELEVVLKKALSLDIDDRYSSMKDFRDALYNAVHIEIMKAPFLSVDLERLDFTEIKPDSSVVKWFAIKNVGNSRLIGKLTTTRTWLNVSPDSIDMEGGEDRLPVTVDTSGMKAGFKESGYINITTNGGNAKIKVILSIHAPPVPQPAEVKEISKLKKGMPVKIIAPVLVIVLAIIGVYYAVIRPGDLGQPAQFQPEAEDLYEPIQSGDLMAPVIENISASSITDNSALIIWSTDEPATSCIEFGKDENFVQATPVDETLTTTHSVTMKGLELYTIYYYRARSQDAEGNEVLSETCHLTTHVPESYILPAAQPRQPPPEGATLILQDGFDDPGSGLWAVYDTSDSCLSYEDGAYSIRLKSESWCFAKPNIHHKLKFTDFVIEADVKNIEGNYYIYGFQGLSGCGYGSFNGGRHNSNTVWASEQLSNNNWESMAWDNPDEEVNFLRIIRQDGKLKVFINDRPNPVINCQQEFNLPVALGICVGRKSYVHFDNFRLYSLDYEPSGN